LYAISPLRTAPSCTLLCATGMPALCAVLFHLQCKAYYARRRCPAKIDIGPIFNVDPQKRSAYGGLGSDRVFAPVERELVFDVVRRFALPCFPAYEWCTLTRFAPRT
jgi:hypothetical protein